MGRVTFVCFEVDVCLVASKLWLSHEILYNNTLVLKHTMRNVIKCNEQRIHV